MVVVNRSILSKNINRPNHALRRSSLIIASLIAWVATDTIVNDAKASRSAPNVVSGSVSSSTKASASAEYDSHTIINQTTDKAIIEWDNFSVSANEHLEYKVPSASSVTLNRVVGQDLSIIAGKLSSNGQLIITNPNGVVFSEGAQVDSAGLIATTHQISNVDFLNENYNFIHHEDAEGMIINEGTIKVADTGAVALVAPGVENRGVIIANHGTVALSTGHSLTLDFYGDNLINFTVNGQMALPQNENGETIQSRITQTESGEIIADAGKIIVSATVASSVINNTINLDGIIQANSIADKNGEIILYADYGNITLSSHVLAQGDEPGEIGGIVKVTGDAVHVTGDALINTSGMSGGGTVLIGGDYQGQGTLKTATTTTIDSGAQINADAINDGDGGRIIVWSDNHTDVHGTLSATGGAVSGDGGFIETSGKKTLNTQGITLDLSANAGEAGSWLLDPETITIDTAYLTSNSIITQLNAGTNVTLQTDDAGAGTITIADTISWSGSGNLIIEALGSDGNLNIDADVISSGTGDLTLRARGDIIASATYAITASGGGSVTLTSDYDANNTGDINVNNITGNGSNTISLSGKSLTHGTIDQFSTVNLTDTQGDYTVDFANLTNVGNLNVTASTGDININATSFTSSGTQTYNSAVVLGANTALTGTTVNFNNTVNGGFSLTINGNAFFDQAVGGNSSLTSVSVSGDTELSAFVTTSGTQTYTGAVTLDINSRLVGSTVNFGSTVDSASGQNYELDINGNATFADDIGRTQALQTFDVSGTTQLGGDIILATDGDIITNGLITLTDHVTISAQLFDIDGQIDGQNSYDLSLINTEGNFARSLSDIDNIRNFSLNSTSDGEVRIRGDANGDSFTTTGTQTYGSTGGGDVNIDRDIILVSPGGVTFNNDINADNGGTEYLQITGDVVFTGSAGATRALQYLTVSGTTTINGDVRTTGIQTYSGATTLNADSVLTASTVNFDSTLNGAQTLAITGNAVFNDIVGGSTDLTSLSVSGTSTINTNISTTGLQTYSGASTLSTDSVLTASTVNFGSTLDGAQTLTITGNADFDGTVGGSTDLTSLSVSGTSNIGANISTTGLQTYSGAGTLSDNSILTASTVNFGSTLDGGQALTITGNADFDGAIGDSTDLTSLSVSGTSNIGANISTTGLQTYSGASTLSANNTLTASTVNFGSTLDGAQTLTITGNANFDDIVGGNTDLTSLSVSGTSDIGANISTTGLQTYSGASTLSANNTLTASTVNFGSTLDGAQTLIITGNANFDGIVGDSTDLTSLSVSGTSDIGANISTTGLQTYSGVSTLSADSTLTASTVNFGSTLDGAQTLTITGNANFDDVVGGNTDLTSLSVSGTSDIGANISTTGLQTYSGASTLSANNTLTASTVNFGSTLDGAQTLTITGNANFDGAVGDNTDLTSLSVSGTSNIGANISTTGTQTYTGTASIDDGITALFNTSDSTITFSSNLEGTSGGGSENITFNTGSGSLNISGSVGNTSALNQITLTQTGGATFFNSFNANTVTVTDTNGTIAFNGDTNISTALNTASQTYSLSFTGSNNTIAGDTNFLNTGFVTIGNSASDTTTFIGGLGLTGNVSNPALVNLAGTINTTNAQINIGKANLNDDTTINAGSSSAAVGIITGDGNALSLSADAGITQTGAFNGLSTFNANDILAISDNITTTGNQNYNAAVTLSADSILTAATVNFASTLDGAQDLTITGNVNFDGAVGGNTDLNSLSISGTSNINASINTDNAQTYTGLTTLDGNHTLSASTVNIITGIQGLGNDDSLTLNLTGTHNLDASKLSGLQNLTLTGTGTTNIDGNLSLSGALTSNRAVGFDSNATLTLDAVTFNNTVTTNKDITINLNATGDVVFSTASADNTFGSLTINKEQFTIESGATVTTLQTDTATGKKFFLADNIKFDRNGLEIIPPQTPSGTASPQPNITDVPEEVIREEAEPIIKTTPTSDQLTSDDEPLITTLPETKTQHTNSPDKGIIAPHQNEKALFSHKSYAIIYTKKVHDNSAATLLPVIKQLKFEIKNSTLDNKNTSIAALNTIEDSIYQGTSQADVVNQLKTFIDQIESAKQD